MTIPRMRPAPAAPSTAAVHPSAAPELYWIGTSTQSSCLWPESPSPGEVEGLEVFLLALADASARIWILDPHFEGEEGYEVLKPWIQSALDIARSERRRIDVRIMTGRLGELEAWIENNSVAVDEVQRKGTARPLHDRYAVVDDDLWHFGSTVGGGHPGLSSASRGWGRHVNNFETLFRSWWEASR